MTDPQESESGQDSGRDASRPNARLRSQESDEATMRRSIANASPFNFGFAYSAPETGADPERPVTRLGLVWRIVASTGLAAVGINAVVVIIRLLARTEPGWVGALGMAVIAMLALAYPAVNVARLVRSVRRRRQGHAV